MLTLRAGTSSVVVAPEHGAGLTGWLLGSTPLLRRALPQTAIGGDPRAMGCFPLLPYGNRIAHARFRWLGVDYALRENFGDNPHTIHGVGWQRAWTVEATSPTSALQSLRHSPDASWPFAFQASVEYRLSPEALTIALQMTNRHDTAAPAGIGIHPFFPKANDPSLRFAASGAWETGPDALPLRQGPLPADWSHAASRRIADSRLDNCFTGWDGRADILAGPASLRIEASPVFRHLQVFTPDWADFFCAEPVSHAPDAINRPDLPVEQAMHVLRPNETLSGMVRLSPTGQ
ncbi:MAG TPA: epimerase [Acetobacteraceae bacterium]|jgi:aldose 1-epimerase|nr:epimerase [Acetobacteraceae bacterium]